MDIATLIDMADRNDTSALAELGRIYREGDGVDIDIEKAVCYLRRAADTGDAGSASSLGYMYLTGDGVDPDRSEAERFLTIAADLGNPVAMCNLGVLFSDSDPGRSMDWFMKAAEAGSVRGMKNIAAAYSIGQGVPMDKKISAEWYSKAADAGDVDSMCVLASMLRNGDGIDTDKVKAAELYRKAADTGDMGAQYDLAFMLDSGEGIPQDREEAESYFRLSADQGDTDACLCMGGILFERRDFEGAEHYFLSAAMKDDVKAQYNLGLLYIGDYLGEPDMEKAREWFEYSADQGFAYAQTMLGNMSMETGDVVKAEGFFRSAAQQGEPMAQYNLGAMGLSNQIRMDFQESVEWLTKAAQQGVEDAYRILMQLNSQQ